MTQPAHFITPLRMEALLGDDGLPLYSRDGRRLYKLLSPLVYWSAKYERLFVVKDGFITDLGSVPRLPIVYTLFGDIAEEPYPLHDMLYSKGALPREDADALRKQGVGPPAADRHDGDEPVAGNAVDQEAHLVHVSGNHDFLRRNGLSFFKNNQVSNGVGVYFVRKGQNSLKNIIPNLVLIAGGTA